MNRPPVFTPDEIERFRTEIADRRAPGAYVPGHWSVSPLNRDPDVVGEVPPSVVLRDTTLRGIETLPGVVVSAEQKASYLRELVRAGVGSLVSTRIGNRSDEELRAEVGLVRAENPDCRIVCPLMFSTSDIDRAAQAGFDTVQVWVQGFGEASLIYSGIYESAWRGQDWRTSATARSREQVLARAVPLIEYARGKGLAVSTPLLMVSYLTPDVLAESVDTLTAAGATELTLFDGPGGLGPEAFAALVGATKKLAPTVEVGLHPHNTFGLGVACAVAAVKAGAGVVDVSVNGYCGGPGNADLAATVMAFEALYGVRTGIDPGMLTGLARAGERLTGFRTAWNHPVTGEKAFSWGGMDIITQEITVDPLLHNCIEPELVGNRRVVPFTPDSGPYTLAVKLDELGVAADTDQVLAVLAAARRQMTTTGALLPDADLAALATAVLARV